MLWVDMEIIIFNLGVEDVCAWWLSVLAGVGVLADTRYRAVRRTRGQLEQP